MAYVCTYIVVLGQAEGPSTPKLPFFVLLGALINVYVSQLFYFPRQKGTYLLTYEVLPRSPLTVVYCRIRERPKFVQHALRKRKRSAWKQRMPTGGM